MTLKRRKAMAEKIEPLSRLGRCCRFRAPPRGGPGRSVQRIMTAHRNERLKAIFVVALRLPPETDTAVMRRVAVENWDSLAHISIVAGIEGEFGLSLDARDIERISSFEAARLLVEERAR